METIAASRKTRKVNQVERKVPPTTKKVANPSRVLTKEVVPERILKGPMVRARDRVLDLEAMVPVRMIKELLVSFLLNTIHVFIA